MIEQGLFGLIQSASPVAALVDFEDGAGLYWVVAPKGCAYPLIVMQRIGTDDTYTFAGSTDFRAATFQIDCYSSGQPNYYQARRIANAVRDLLKSFKGTLPDGTVVSAVFTTKDWDMPYEEGSTGFVCRVLLEFRVWYQDAS